MSRNTAGQLAFIAVVALAAGCKAPAKHPEADTKDEESEPEPVPFSGEGGDPIKAGHRTAAAEMPEVAPTYLGQCRYSGSVRNLHARLQASTGGPVLAILRDGVVDSVGLPAVSGEAVKAQLSWPLVGPVYLAAPGAVRLTREVEFVEGHLAARKYARLPAMQLDDETARITLALGDADHVYEAALPCSELSLDAGPEQPFDQDYPDNARGMTTATPLFAARGHEQLGHIGSRFTTVLVEETHSDWTRVRSWKNGAIDYSGWISSSVLKDAPNYLGLLREDPIATPFRTATQTALLIDGQPSGLTIAVDIPVLVGRREGPLLEVAVAGLWAPPQQSHWIAAADIVESSFVQ